MSVFLPIDKMKHDLLFCLSAEVAARMGNVPITFVIKHDPNDHFTERLQVVNEDGAMLGTVSYSGVELISVQSLGEAYATLVEDVCAIINEHMEPLEDDEDD